MRKIIITIDDDGRFVDITTEEVEKAESCFDKPEYSQYAVTFDTNSIAFRNDRDMDMLFLKYTENYCNQRLRIIGELYLCEVYKALGIPIMDKDKDMTERVGWKYGLGSKPWSDQLVIFDIIDDGDKIMIDFNVDGNIGRYIKV